jgi:hypothetical protein
MLTSASKTGFQRVRAKARKYAAAKAGGKRKRTVHRREAQREEKGIQIHI